MSYSLDFGKISINGLRVWCMQEEKAKKMILAEVKNHFTNRLRFFNEFNLLFLILIAIFSLSFLGQFSAFNGKFCAQVKQHLLHINIAVIIMLLVYLGAFKMWHNFAYLFYVASFAALLFVAMAGTARLGARRWIDLYFITFQPSEMMKLFLILALARYYSALSGQEICRLSNHIFPLLLILMPAFVVLKQPDLGTACILLLVGFGIIFMSGFPLKIFLISAVSALIICPFGWFFLRNYQKNRILALLNPDADPTGIGYHVLQSKIAIGSGYIFGKGLLQGTQSKLNFLPEKNTDFIFTTMAEEFGFLGSMTIILLFCALTCYFFWVGNESKRPFAKLVCCGLGLLVFIHVFVNIAMVTGIAPVVGIPLPFLSYGGSSIMTFAAGCGLIMAAVRWMRS
ncbi:MAG: rod shape-determining protein RodA [Holosporaceae bacterium]|jgi:rod shape determining protein RodA|nr:rod shape-determining protein RodA [Holosporaceae bacterium]